jgi:hypothetical protein
VVRLDATRAVQSAITKHDRFHRHQRGPKQQQQDSLVETQRCSLGEMRRWARQSG